MLLQSSLLFFFFFNDTATTEIYTLSLHDALPIYLERCLTFYRTLLDRIQTSPGVDGAALVNTLPLGGRVAKRSLDLEGFIVSRGRTSRNDETFQVQGTLDRKSTRLNSSHSQISYAVFCLKKKKK